MFSERTLQKARKGIMTSKEGAARQPQAIKGDLPQEISTFQIVNAKEHFLESALRLITPAVENGDEVVCLPEDIEELARDTINLFTTLLRCDEQHNLLAATAEEYPYQAAEEELADLFLRFLAVCDALRGLVDTLQRRGFEIKSQRDLEAVCTRAHYLARDDEAFYETEPYHALAERALTEYQTGQVEEWPI